MKRKNITAGVLILIAIVALGGIWLYNWVLGDTKPASGELAAPTLAINIQPTLTGVMPISPTQETISPTLASTLPPASSTLTHTPAATDGVAALPAQGMVFQISQAESQARFTIYELLRGEPKNVVGVTDQIAGQIALDPNNLAAVQIGEILINARTLVTDEDRRNQAIRNRILFTDQYEFISFKPTSVTGLTGTGVPGQTYTFQIAGDLTIRDITQPVVFEVTLTAETPTRLMAAGKTVIQRSDFKLTIPSVPFVADVSQDVTLEVTLVLLVV